MKIKKGDDISQMILGITENISLNEKEKKDLGLIFSMEREPIISGLLNFRKHQAGEASWRRHKWKNLLGIKKWHRSVASKRFNRQLGSYLATKIIPDKVKIGYRWGKDQKDESFSPGEKYEVLTALSSMRTHLYIEGQFLLPRLEESVEMNFLVEYAAPILLEIENRVFSNESYKLTEDETELLLRLTETTALLRSCAESWNIPYKDLNKLYTQLFEEQKKTESSNSEYFLLHLFENIYKHIQGNNLCQQH